DAGDAVQRPLRLPDQRPAEAGVDDRPEVEARQTITFELDARRHSNDWRELPLDPQHAEVSLRRGRVEAGGADGGGRRFHLPYEPAPVRGEISAGRGGVRVAARTDERGADLRVPK